MTEVTVYSLHSKLNLSILGGDLELAPTANPAIFHAIVPLEVAVEMESVPGCASRVLADILPKGLPALDADAEDAPPAEVAAETAPPAPEVKPKPGPKPKTPTSERVAL